LQGRLPMLDMLAFVPPEGEEGMLQFMPPCI
jgi:hypothetical protein